MTLEELIQTKIDERGASFRSVADDLGVSHTQVMAWADGYSQPTGSHIKRVQLWLGIDAQTMIDLLDGGRRRRNAGGATPPWSDCGRDLEVLAVAGVH